MATTISPPLLPCVTSLNGGRQNVRSLTVRCNAHSPNLTNRRQLLISSLTATSAAMMITMPSLAEDIPLFGLRKKLKRAEEEAVELVKEGFETAEKGLETAEKGIENAEKGIENAEKEIESTVSFSGLAQAGVVAGAEFVGVVIASTIDCFLYQRQCEFVLGDIVLFLYHACCFSDSVHAFPRLKGNRTYFMNSPLGESANDAICRGMGRSEIYVYNLEDGSTKPILSHPDSSRVLCSIQY
ncbi:hypothetical protein ACFE04_022620 [Oxalis oulophora]